MAGYAGQQPQAPASHGLPAGWRAADDANGNTYYVNDMTKTTQWESPVSTQTPSDVEAQVGPNCTRADGPGKGSQAAYAPCAPCTPLWLRACTSISLRISVRGIILAVRGRCLVPPPQRRSFQTRLSISIADLIIGPAGIPCLKTRKLRVHGEQSAGCGASDGWS